MKLSKNYLAVVALCAAPIFSTSAFAVHYDFNVTYDGSSATSDSGYVDPIGTSLIDGDSYTYNLRAAIGGYWQVNDDETTEGSNTSFFPFLSFAVEEIGVRIADITLSLFLDGTQQGATLEEDDIDNAWVHLGTNSVDLTAGLQFDEIVLMYELMSSTGADITDIDNPIYNGSIGATINQLSIGPNLPGGFTSGISYVSPVPVPAAVWLFGSALLGLGVVKRRKARS